MPSTNKTPNLHLSQFDGSDTPKWLQDYNSDMSNIDAAVAILNTANLDLINKIYPIGSIYESVNNASPASFIGGTWISYGAGCVLVGDGTSDATYSVNSLTNAMQGGASSHILDISEMPSHKHGLRVGTQLFTPGTERALMTTDHFWQGSDTFQCQNNGSGQPHNNMPPYMVVYRWRRTA